MKASGTHARALPMYGIWAGPPRRAVNGHPGMVPSPFGDFTPHLAGASRQANRRRRARVGLRAHRSGWSITQNSLPSGSRMTMKSAPSGYGHSSTRAASSVTSRVHALGADIDKRRRV